MIMIKGLMLVLGFLAGFSQVMNAQVQTQVVKGTVTDKISEKPLAGATVTVAGLDIGAVTDAAGNYELPNVPLGRRQFLFVFSGYREAAIPEVLVTAGKQVILDVALEQLVKRMDEVVIRSNRIKKGNATNEFATASARSFSADEITRYAGGRNDPSKLVSNFAGVAANSDARNDIVVRGNSPTGVLWRIEGIPAPSPNHYATLGTTGGPVSALNTNALKTSDFYTGAFPAEFGNANSAVFDIQLRTGNTSRHERTFQINAFSGMEAMLEGPLGKKKGGSYLAGYRYSFAELANKFGLNVGTTAVPRYQDWVFNVQSAKGKAGRISLFGMGGISKIDFLGSELGSEDFYSRQDQDAYSRQNFFNFGVKHTIDIGSKSYLRTVASYTRTTSSYEAFQYQRPAPPYTFKWLATDIDDKTNTFRFSSYFNSKTNSRFSWRSGITAEVFQLKSYLSDIEGLVPPNPLRIIREYDGNFTLLQAFAQGKYQVNNQLSFTGGLHGMSFTFNKTSILEPRLAMNYKIGSKQSVYLSYGLHGQLQPFPVYLSQSEAGGIIDRRNRDLDFTRSQHFVAGYEFRFRAEWRVKGEIYYQRLTDVPVESTLSGFSILNTGSDFGFPDKTGLVNTGTGYNRGMEFSLERFLNNGYYLLATASLFDSKYKGSDGVLRNTSFNYGHVVNLLGGGERKLGQSGRKAFTLDMRLSFIGGRYATPINEAASLAAGREILDESRYNEEKLDAYFRLDTKFGFRINSKKRKLSQTFYLDFQNLTNRQNIFLRQYNPEKGKVGNVYQIGFFPDVLYRIQF